MVTPKKQFHEYSTRKIKVNGETLEIEPYRVAEIKDYVSPIYIVVNHTNNVGAKSDYYLKKGRENLTPAEMDELTKLDDEAITLKDGGWIYNGKSMDGLTVLSYKLAQLGLKRAKYPEAYDKVGPELDEYDDVPILRADAMKVTNLMINLAEEGMPKLKESGQKKPKGSRQKKPGKDSGSGS